MVEKKELGGGDCDTTDKDSNCSGNNTSNVNSSNNTVINKEELDDKEKHQLKHRELFLSRQVETLPATHIRGKCAVTLLNETESLMYYLNKEVSVEASSYRLITHVTSTVL